jgi:MFS superfamily sulfate permease-like transporter
MDLGATYYVDLEGADVLQSIKKGLDIHHIKFHLAEVSKEVLHFLESTGVDRVIGRANICQSVDEAVQEFLHEEEAITGARVERENRSS